MNDSFNPGNLIRINIENTSFRNFISFKNDGSFLYIELKPLYFSVDGPLPSYFALENVNELFLVNQIIKLEELPPKIVTDSYNNASSLIIITSLSSNIQFLEQFDDKFVNSFKAVNENNI